MFIQSFDPRPSPVDMLLQAVRVYDWSLWLIILTLTFMVTILLYNINFITTRRKSCRIVTNCIKLMKTMVKVLLCFVDEPDFDSKTLKELVLLSVTLIGFFIITRVALNLIATEMIRADIMFYTSLADLDGSSPDDIHIIWLANGYAVKHFQNSKNEVATRILESRGNERSILGLSSWREAMANDPKLLAIEEDVVLKYLVPAVCGIVKFPLKVTYVQELQTPFAVTFNHLLNESVKDLIRDS